MNTTVKKIMNQTGCLALLLLLFGVACSKKPGTSVDGSGYGSDYDDYIDIEPLPERQANVSFYGPGNENVLKDEFPPVYFNFDSFSISGQEREKVHHVAEYLLANNANILLAGHTDSQGTSEYNRILGERRAIAVRRALLRLGIPGSRIQTVSFGEDKPIDPGNHSVNRRCAFGVIKQ